jgi:S1-C subfamily serine protease
MATGFNGKGWPPKKSEGEPGHRARRSTTAAALFALAGMTVSPESVLAAASIDDVLAAVVGVTAEVPADARSAATLGTERSGNGVVIDSDGLVLTIGYLIMESTQTTITAADGREIPADFVGYDYETGFGLIRARAKLGVKPLVLGSAAALKEKTPVLVAGFGGRDAAHGALVVSRREFAGYWEYLLDDAIFTAPIYERFGGAALIDGEGKLVGIGSLAVGDAAGPDPVVPGNMFVPIDILKPIMADLLEKGRPSTPPKPWIGVITREANGRLYVIDVSAEGPAARAGLKRGDIVLSVAGKAISGQADFYKKLWASGPAGTSIELSILHERDVKTVKVGSIDRYDWMKTATRH